MTDLSTANTDYLMYIDGEFCEASDGGRFESVNPANGLAWATAPAATEEDVDRAVRAAHRALREGPWPAMTATQRGKLLFRLADLMEEHSELLGSVETTDSGKLAVETRGQSAYVAEYYRYYGGLADKIQGATLPMDKPDLHVYTLREPIGVVAGVVPCRLVEEAGFPPGVFNLVTGFGEPCGRALTSHPLVSRVSFTGGTEAARHVVANTANNFAHLSLELGGKSPILVFDDADLEGAVNGAVAGNFGASGQSCVAGSRVFVQSGIYADFIDAVVQRAEQVRIGDPLEADTQMGPLATQAQRDRAEEVVAESVAQGATLHTGGGRPPGLEAGWYFQPTLLGCPDQSIRSTQVELFAPVMSALKFETEEEGIALANDTVFGLGAGVFTENLARAHRVAAAVHSGIVWINTYRAISPISPFGGYGQSGYGREAGLDVIQEFTRTKAVWVNTSSAPMANPFVMR